MASLVQKSEQIVRKVGSSNNTAAGSQQIRIPLNRDSLVAEYRVRVLLSQSVGVAAPTSADVRRLFTSITLQNSDNDRMTNTDFAAAYELGRFTETQVTPVIGAFVIGTNTADFGFEIHLEGDDLSFDMASAMQTLGMSNLQLVFNVAPDASSVFTGGAGSTYAAQNVTITVEEEAYPDMIGEFPWGARVQNITSFPKATNGAAGAQENIKLNGMNHTRFIMVQAYDVSGAVPVPRDDLIGDILVTVGNATKRETTYNSLKRANTTMRGYTTTGTAVIDQGDNETQMLNFTQAGDVYFKYNTLVAVATRIVVTQVSFTDNGKIVFTRGEHRAN